MRFDGEITRINGKTFDEERALYGLHNAEIADTKFSGPADGESALKECGNLVARGCDFRLRYPLWHVTNAEIENCSMADTCRAALWYDKNIYITNSKLGGIKALRECDGSTLKSCEIDSVEFGWFCRGLSISDCELNSEYPFLRSCDMEIDNLTMTGKYSFQYVENAVIRNSNFNTKDAFWHSKNVTVYDSVIDGEYLAWYSENLRLVRCKISGTQPLCYAKGLILEDCEMRDCDLSFEKSEVTADVRGEITSVKNPLSGTVTADTIGEIIFDEPWAKGNVVTRK